MAVIELDIIPLKAILSMKITLPSYQRSYSWSIKSANTLFMDTYEAFTNGIKEYRLGSVILHKENTEKYNIVDGQQRLTTLLILLYCLDYKEPNMLKEKHYDKMVSNTIITNHTILNQRIKEIADDNKRLSYKKYLLEKCTTVLIVTDSEQEAFQFFDSQNTRGKELDPHDLLKSYHLREMNNEPEESKIEIINRWENIKQNELADLFKNYLYPITQWFKKKDGLNYSSSKIDSFKGIKRRNTYNFSIYHKASNLYIEHFNANDSNDLLTSKFLNQFQLTQPLVAGKRFFYYTLHYKNLLEKIQNKINNVYNLDEIPSKRPGDIYIKQLYECALLFFADRFGLESLTEAVMQQLYSWSYSLRLTMYAVYLQTINKYAIGKHERVNCNVDMFSIISEMSDPDELKLILFQQPDIINDKEKYKDIYELLCKQNGWQYDK